MKVLFTAACMALAQVLPVLAPADNLVIERVPSPPLALVDEVNRYTEFRTAQLGSWHPEKRQMLIETRFADTRQIHLVKFPGGARSQLTFFRDNARSGLFQQKDGNYMVFSKDKGGDEFYQKYRYDISGGGATLLTDGRSRNTGGVWSRAGNRLAYGSTRRDGADVDLWVMDPGRGSDHMLAELKGGGWSALAWSPDDRQILAVEEISANESYLWLFDTESGGKTLLTPKNGAEKVLYSGGEFSADGKGIYVATDKDNDFLRLAYIDLSTKKYTYLTDRIKWDVEDFALSTDGKLLAFVTNEDGWGVLHMLDTSTGKDMSLPALPQGLVHGLCWRKNSHELGFSLENARSPEDVYSLDADASRLERWTESETCVGTSNFRQPELVKWTSFDGRTISGFLYSPPDKFKGRRPVLIYIHGGPEGQARPGFMGKLNYYLNELGVAIIFPNVRGSLGYGKTFLALDNGFKRQGSYQDIGALLDWLKVRPDIDSNRVMITGGSYGGFMTLAVATNYNDRIRCSLDVVGPSNLVTFLKNTSDYRRDLRRVEYGDERDPKMREFLESIAPANHADKITKPLFVVQGKNDPRVPFTESEQMVANVRKGGTPVWYLMANDEGHGFTKKRNSDYLFYSTILFMQKYLLN